MRGSWRCPVCGLEFKDEPWRREDAERTVCQNNHPPTKMELIKCATTWEELEKRQRNVEVPHTT